MRANYEEPGPDNFTQLRSIGYLINPDTDVVIQTTKPAQPAFRP